VFYKLNREAQTQFYTSAAAYAIYFG